MTRLTVFLALVLAPTLAFGQIFPGPGGPIPDGGVPTNGTPGAPLVSTVTPPLPGLTVASVVIGLNDLDHSWQGDLWARVSHLGTTVDLFRRPNQGAAPGTAFGFSNDFDVPNTIMYMDGAPGTHASSGAAPITGASVNFASTNLGADITGAGVLGPPTVTPNALAAFAGMPCGGDWTLTITDHAGGDVGMLRAWDLKLSCVPEPAGFAVFGLSLLGMSVLRRRS